MLDRDRCWAYRFHRDEKSWLRDPMVFVDMGRAMPDGSPALLKSRRHLHKDQAQQLWRELVKAGGKRVEPLWGASAEP